MPVRAGNCEPVILSSGIIILIEAGSSVHETPQDEPRLFRRMSSDVEASLRPQQNSHGVAVIGPGSLRKIGSILSKPKKSPEYDPASRIPSVRNSTRSLGQDLRKLNRMLLIPFSISHLRTRPHTDKMDIKMNLSRIDIVHSSAW